MMWHANRRSLVAAAHDAAMAAASFMLSLYIRLGNEQLYLANDYMLEGSLLFTAICMIVFTTMNLYRGLWRFASMRDMVSIFKAVSLAILIFAAVMFVITRLENVPRSVFFINWMLLMGMLAAPRILYRSLKDRRLFWEMTLEEKAKTPVLLIGATALAEQFIQDMARDPRTSYRVVAILDNDPTRHHRMLQRVRIYGGISQMPEVLASLTRKMQRPHKVLIADPGLSGEEVQQVMALADRAALPVARIPRLSDLKRHFDEKMDIQPIALEDLLNRPQAALDREAMASLVQGKRVLVTGAGGSIGRELIRQIAGYAPASLVLWDIGEYQLYEAAREVTANASILGDVRDAKLVEQVFSTHRPEIVFHAAAIKHVPISEDNPEEAILTNVFGTKIIAEACSRHHVSTMVMISTDKAVNPTSVMGASKKLAEMICQSFAQGAGNRTCFTTVRFGNVLGSTGSVVPLFEEQIKKGGPLTVTHPDMTRYFMTIREAVELVLQAAAIGSEMTDARGHIFVLDMGDPVKILDLATQMIRLAGLRPGEDIAIHFTGLRPGEKLHEELFHEAEARLPTPHASIFLASSREARHNDLSLALKALEIAATSRHGAEAARLLKALVPEYEPLSAIA
jgi:FlaA1/EpsC-like NDP-sugar epimerase